MKLISQQAHIRTERRRFKNMVPLWFVAAAILGVSTGKNILLRMHATGFAVEFKAADPPR